MSPSKQENPSTYDPRMITTGQQMIASCSGALFTSLFMTPLDVVKIRLQAQQKPFHRGDCFVYCNGLMDHVCECMNGNGNGNSNGAKTRRMPWFKLPGHFSGTMDAFVKIARNEGIASLWSGLPPTLIMAVPATMIYFTAYDKIKYAMGYREDRQDTLWIVMAAGSTARIGAVTVISPLELIRTKLQSNKHSYQEVCSAVRSAINTGGVLSLWRGLGPTLLRDVPFSALYWLNYESLKSYQLRKTGQSTPTFYQSFFAGSISGTIAGILTLPFDVIKTHRQIELGTADFKTGMKLETTWSLMRRLYAQKGLSGLFAGILPRIAKVAPACAIMISCYEYAKKFFTEHNLQRMEREQGSLMTAVVAAKEDEE